MVRHRLLALPGLLGLVALAGCAGSPPQPGAEAPPPQPPPGAPPATAAATPAQAGKPDPTAPERAKPASPATGLVPLPTPRQVIAALPVGRSDPFASPLPPLPPPPTGPAGAGSPATPGANRGPGGIVSGRPLAPAPLSLPPGLRLTGLIHSGGTSEAVVEIRDPSGNVLNSGSLRRGDRGGRTTDLLPGGWSVAAVDVNRGRVTLQRGQQRVTAEL